MKPFKQTSQFIRIWSISASWLCIVLLSPMATFAQPTPQTAAKHSRSQGFDRYLTLGIGFHTGYFRAGGSKQIEQDSRLIYGFDVHLRLFRAIGVTASYDLNSNVGVQGEVFLPYPQVRLTGHIYMARMGPMFFNLTGGVGLNFTTENGGSPLSAYIVGGELGFKLHNNIVLQSSFRFLLPSYEQAMRALMTAGSTPQQSLPIKQSAMVSVDTLDLLEKIFDFRHFQVTVSLRIFL